MNLNVLENNNGFEYCRYYWGIISPNNNLLVPQ